MVLWRERARRAGCRSGARVADNGPHATASSLASCSRRRARASPPGCRARRARAVRRRFPRCEGRVRARPAGALRRARAAARGARARVLRRILAIVRRDSTRAGADEVRRVSREMARFAARRPSAHRLSEGARQAWRLDGVRRAVSGAVAGEDVELACYGIPVPPAARRRRGARRCEAAVVHRADDAGRLRAAVRGADRDGELSTADRRARFRLATEAGNVRLARVIADGPAGDERIADARVRARSSATPRARWRRASSRWKPPGGRELALYALERAARSDAAGVRAAWEKQRAQLPEADRLYGNARLAFHAARQLDPRANDWYPRGRRRAAERRAARVARARGAARRLRGPTSRRRSRRCRARWRRSPRGATGRRARSPRRARRRGERALLGARRRVPFLRPARGGGAGTAGSSRSASRAQPSPDGARAFGAQPGIRRAVKLAELDMRAESQREWIYVVRGRDDEGLLRRRRLRAPRGTLRPRDQHRRPDDGAARFRLALPDAVPRALRRCRARPGGRRGAAVRASRARSRALRRTSCRRRAPSA